MIIHEKEKVDTPEQEYAKLIFIESEILPLIDQLIGVFKRERERGKKLFEK